MSERYLPISQKDMAERGWDQLDFILVTGDAYVDHLSFGAAIIGRVLERRGYKVGIIAQPNWKDAEDFKKLDRPRLGFLVTAGNMDSMVNHYTVNKKLRDKDYYSPGGKMGLRPDRATIVYCNRIRQAYKDIPIIIGGVEASLRRFAHYDYWSDTVRKSILVDSSADLLIYGMAEKQIVEIADLLNDGHEVQYIRHVAGTCYLVNDLENIQEHILIPSFKQVSEDKRKYAEAFLLQYDEQDPVRGKTIIQPFCNKYLVQNKPEMPLTRQELDEVYGLPFQRNYHPIYESMGGIPAVEEVKFSIISSRGCFGNCSFCSIAFHQGRIVESRSQESILAEAAEITSLTDFKGYIHDVGGPTANFRRSACDKQLSKGTCKNKQCLHPNPCKSLQVDHEEYLALLRRLRKMPKVKKVFVRSGLRYDYIQADKSNTFLKELIEHHVSGQLKVAPEHVSPEVLHYMGKPAGKTYEEFRKRFFKINEDLGKTQFIVPYFMSSHPGSTLESAIELAEYLRDTHYQPEQVQDFYPTPGTLSTTMFYTELDPRTMQAVHVPKSKTEKAMQRALLQFRDPKKYDIVYEALVQAKRTDLIGFGPKCLIRPKGNKKSAIVKSNERQSSKTPSAVKHISGRKQKDIGNVRDDGKQGPNLKGKGQASHIKGNNSQRNDSQRNDSQRNDSQRNDSQRNHSQRNDGQRNKEQRNQGSDKPRQQTSPRGKR